MKTILRFTAAIPFVLIAVSGMALVRGSLESFPTEEQQSGVRLVYGTAFIVLVVMEVAVLAWLRRLTRHGSK